MACTSHGPHHSLGEIEALAAAAASDDAFIHELVQRTAHLREKLAKRALARRARDPTVNTRDIGTSRPTM